MSAKYRIHFRRRQKKRRRQQSAAQSRKNFQILPGLIALGVLGQAQLQHQAHYEHAAGNSGGEAIYSVTWHPGPKKYSTRSATGASSTRLKAWL